MPGLFDRLRAGVGGGGGGGHSRLGSNDVVAITQEGQDELETQGVSENKWAVLSALREHGAMSVNKLAQETGIDEGSIKNLCIQMLATKPNLIRLKPVTD